MKRTKKANGTNAAAWFYGTSFNSAAYQELEIKHEQLPIVAQIEREIEMLEPVIAPQSTSSFMTD